MSDKPNCYLCKYVQSIAGDSHKSCINEHANVVGHPVGIRGGYFVYPYNFDPGWLVSCDGFVKREVD